MPHLFDRAETSAGSSVPLSKNFASRVKEVQVATLPRMTLTAHRFCSRAMPPIELALVAASVATPVSWVETTGIYPCLMATPDAEAILAQEQGMIASYGRQPKS